MASGQQFLFAPEKPLVKRLGKKFFRKIPNRAGVYKMRDAQDNIVYVGKAKNLRQRLRSYRVANPEHMARRHLRMVREVARIEFDFCPNETAALKHEAKLIRELKPKYNRAGVWQGKPQFLTWRFSDEKIEFSVHEVPPVGWERYGSIGAYAPRLRASLMRLLWLAMNPQTGFGWLPHGWAQGKFGDAPAQDCREHADEIRTALENLFWGRPELFLVWMAVAIQSDAPAFERAVVMADVDEIQEFIAHRRDGAVPNGQIALL
jgi:predicted GIY-YIG superfamily endonuclease